MDSNRAALGNAAAARREYGRPPHLAVAQVVLITE